MPKKAKYSVGQKIGRRTILEQVQETPRSKWKVQCECGYIFICLSQDLNRKGPCLMCGHKGPRPYRRKRPYEVNYNTLLKRAKHPVLLSYEEYLLFTKIKECHYCGAILFWMEYRQKGKGCGSNLDRKDSAKPYEVNNLVACCPRCNYAKNTFFIYEEWVKIGNLIRSWRTKE